MIVYEDTELPAGPFPTVLNGEEALVLHIDDGSYHGETGDIDDPEEWEGETIVFESQQVFVAWAREIAECAGLKVTP